MAVAHQRILPFGAVRNSELFSSHWIDQRLPLEPEFSELRVVAQRTLDQLANLWRTQKPRVEHYGAEQQLEHAFIQPVMQALGWQILYQVHLRGRDPDYALFLDGAALDRALGAGSPGGGVLAASDTCGGREGVAHQPRPATDVEQPA